MKLERWDTLMIGMFIVISIWNMAEKEYFWMAMQVLTLISYFIFRWILDLRDVKGQENEQ